MKTVLPTSPVFTPGAAGVGTLNFTKNGLIGSTFDNKRLYAVINQTRNVLIYAETVSGIGFTAWNNTTKVLTLQLNTSTYSSGDSLQVIYDDPNAALTESTGAIIESLLSDPQAAVGTISTVNSGVTLVLSGADKPAYASITAAYVGSFTGIVECQVTIDNANYTTVPFTIVSTGVSATQLTTQNTIIQFSVVGAYAARIIATTSNGGSSSIFYKLSTAPVSGVYAEVEIKNSTGNAIPVSAASLPLPTGAATNTTLTDGTQKTQVTSLPSLPAGSNTIGNVGVSGAVEITNDAGNAIPISAASLPLPTGAATESTAGTIKNLLQEPSAEITNTFNAVNQSYSVTIAGSNQVQCQSITAVVPATYFFGGTIVVQGTLDNITWANIPLYNLQNNTVAAGITTFGEPYQANTSGFLAVRFYSTVWSSGSAIITFRRSQSPSRLSNNSSVIVTSLPSLPAGSNNIGSVGVSGSVEISNDTGNAVPVSLNNPLPAGSNLIGNVGVTGSVEITNDIGNAVPVSGTVSVSGVATESTLSSIRTNVSEPGLENTFTFNGIPQFAIIQIAGSVSGVPVVQCQSITAIISSSWNFSGTIVIEGSIDGLAFKQLDLLNLTTGSTAATISSIGEAYQFSTVGWANIRFRVLSYSSGQGQVTFRRSQAPAKATSSGVASNVSVTNFPATQAVSGTVEITNDAGNAIPISAASLPLPTGAATNTTLTDGNQKTQVTSLPALPSGTNTIGNVGVSGTVEITNDVGNAVPVSGTVTLGSGSSIVGSVYIASSGLNLFTATVTSFPTGAASVTAGWLYGLTFAVENADTGYGLEPIFVKLWFNSATTPTLGVTAPSLVLQLSDGLKINNQFWFQTPFVITGLYGCYIAMTRFRSNTDTTAVLASVTSTSYTRAT